MIFERYAILFLNSFDFYDVFVDPAPIKTRLEIIGSRCNGSQFILVNLDVDGAEEQITNGNA